MKWSDAVEGLGDKVDDYLCGRLYKVEDASIFNWPGTDPDKN